MINVLPPYESVARQSGGPRAPALGGKLGALRGDPALGDKRGLRGVSRGHPGMFWGCSGDVPGMIPGLPGPFPEVKNDEIS